MVDSDMYEAILTHLRKHISLTDQQAQIFLDELTVRNVAKKEYVLRQEQACCHVYFVNKGVLRAFYTSAEGKETTVMFAVKDWWITDMHSFSRKLPAMVSIQAIAASQIFCLTKDQLDSLFLTLPKLESWFRILMQNAYIREQLRGIEHLSLTAEERYYRFLQKYPQIVPHVTQKQIASYLGITPEFLSAIRAQR